MTTATATTATNTAQVNNAQGSIFRLFYTHKRTQILLEDGWVNAQGIKVEGVKVKRVEKVSTTANYTDKKTGEVTTKYLNCVHVVYISASGKRCSQFISCRAYLSRATQKRKEEATNYQAYQNYSTPSQWTVYPKSKAETPKAEKAARNEEYSSKKYEVISERDGIYCNCPDYENQPGYLQQHSYLWKLVTGRVVCKHSFCVLSHLGFGSLRDYLKAWQPGGSLSNLATTMNRTTRVVR